MTKQGTVYGAADEMTQFITTSTDAQILVWDISEYIQFRSKEVANGDDSTNEGIA